VLQLKKLQRYEVENRDLSSDNTKLEGKCKKLNSELQRIKRTLEVSTGCSQKSWAHFNNVPKTFGTPCILNFNNDRSLPVVPCVVNV